MQKNKSFKIILVFSNIYVIIFSDFEIVIVVVITQIHFSN